MGIPITMDILKRQLFCHIKIHDHEPNYKLFSQVYIKDNKKMTVFLKRSLEYSQFTNRYSSVSQKKSSKLERTKYCWCMSCA